MEKLELDCKFDFFFNEERYNAECNAADSQNDEDWVQDYLNNIGV